MNISTPILDHAPRQGNSVTIVSIDVVRLIEQIDALQPGKQRQKTAQFQKLYPAIEHALARNVPQKTVVAQLENMELSVSMGGFRSLLEAERKQRAERGEFVHCEHCGSILPRSIDAPSPEASTSLASLVPKDLAMRTVV